MNSLLELVAEHNRKVQRVRAFRPDLSEVEITSKIVEFTMKHAVSAAAVLDNCIDNAMQGAPMPWEQQTKKGVENV